MQEGIANLEKTAKQAEERAELAEKRAEQAENRAELAEAALAASEKLRTTISRRLPR